MYSTQCSLELGNQRYIEVCTVNNGESRIDCGNSKRFSNQRFSFGFKIPSCGERKFRLSENLSSLEGKSEVLFDKIQKEIQARIVAFELISISALL